MASISRIFFIRMAQSYNPNLEKKKSREHHIIEIVQVPILND